MYFDIINQKPIIKTHRRKKYGELYYDFIDAGFHLSETSHRELGELVQKYVLLYGIKKYWRIGTVSGEIYSIPLECFDELVDAIRATLVAAKNWSTAEKL